MGWISRLVKAGMVSLGVVVFLLFFGYFFKIIDEFTGILSWPGLVVLFVFIFAMTPDPDEEDDGDSPERHGDDHHGHDGHGPADSSHDGHGGH